MAIPDSLNPLRIPDFNGDGRTDRFSFNANTPQIDLLGGVRLIGSSAFNLKLEDWQPPKFGDFNGDRKTDLIWRNPKTGENGIWLIDGITVRQAAYLEPLQGAWTDVVGDFDGNGKSDLFWYNSSTGDYQVWLMDGVQRVQQTIGKIESGWEATIADFNHDNRSDLFWRNPTTGQNGVWTFDPQTLAIQAELIASKPSTWGAEVIDSNGDGRSDLLWRDRLTGQNQIWRWTSNSLQPDPTPTEIPAIGSDFVIKPADFEGNGSTTLLVRNPSTGENQVWRIGGAEVQISTIATQPAGFQAIIGDYNGDRFSDIYWTSTDGKASTIWFSDGIVPRPMLV